MHDLSVVWGGSLGEGQKKVKLLFSLCFLPPCCSSFLLPQILQSIEENLLLHCQLQFESCYLKYIVKSNLKERNPMGFTKRTLQKLQCLLVTRK